MIKAVFFDIDGTILSHSTKQVPPSTKKSLQLLKEQGILTFIATGRHISEMKDLPINDLEFEGYITLNGQYCYNDKEVIHSLPIQHEDVENILHEIENNPIPCIFVEKDIMYINYNNDIVAHVQESISTPLPDEGDIRRAYTHPIYQVMPYGVTSQDEKNIMQLMPHCKATRWHDLSIDIIPSLGGKQNGIQKVLEYYHIQQDETMAFGDGFNDLDMLNYVEIGIAMKNAPLEVQQNADDVTDDIDHDGIKNALIKYQVLYIDDFEGI